MKKIFAGLFFVCALMLSACQQEAPKPAAPAATPAVAVATPAPTAAPVDYAGGLMTAKSSLEKALTDLKAKNYTGAVESLDAAHKGLAGLTAGAPALLQSGLETAGKGIESAKALVEKKDKGAEKSLTGLIASVSKLADTAKTAAGGGLAGAAAAAGSMVKDAAGAAGAATKDAVKGAAQKLAPAEKKPAEKK